MSALSVVIVAVEGEQRTVLQVMVDGTNVAHVVHVCGSLPVAVGDPGLRRMQSLAPDVVIVDIPADNTSLAVRSIELLHQEMPKTVLFAMGSMSQAQVIVNAMRAGASEYLARPSSTTELLEAFIRLSTAQRKVTDEEPRGKVFLVVNAKGGCGATTVAVNLALALHSAHGNVALVDLAPLGHSALHLNLKPMFSVLDAIRNLHRLDSSLLESFMARQNQGLHVLAGPNAPELTEPSTAEFARLFDMMVGHYRYVVVDASTRMDATTRLVSNLSETVLVVAHADVPSLWSATRVHQFLTETGVRERVQLVLNRYRKVSGFGDTDAENASGMKLLWKVPNQYFAVSAAIDRGVPLMQQSSTEISRSISGLADRLTESDPAVRRAAWSLFKSV